MKDLTEYYHKFDKYQDGVINWRPDLTKAYEKDGVVYCGICGKPILKPVPEILASQYPEKVMALHCDCYKKLKKAHEEAEEKQLAEDNKAYAIQEIANHSLMDLKYKEARFETFDNDREPMIINARNRAEAYCNNAKECYERHLGIYFYGMSELGKSHIMGCMANRLMENLYTCMFASIAQILTRIRATFSSDSDSKETESSILEDIASVDFLFLDDLGIENMNSFANEKLYSIINTRYNSGKPTIFSSNYTINELEQKGWDKQSLSRINEMATVRIKLEGTGYRSRLRHEALSNIPF